MKFNTAIMREPGPSFADGLTTANLGSADYATMLHQHEAYAAALRDLEVSVHCLPALPGHPDAHFVEDAAVVTEHQAIICRPGAPSRQGEAEPMARELSKYRELARIEAPGTVDGGDVLIAGQRCLIGLSQRTNEAGARQLAELLAAEDIRCQMIPVKAGLHLKSSVNELDEDTLLVTREFADVAGLQDFDLLVVPEGEDYAANTLVVNDTILMPVGFEKTHAILRDAGLPVYELACSESQKMDGGLSCLSLRFNTARET